MRFLSVALLASLALTPACDTTQASVPHLAPAEARVLVTTDLAELRAHPTELQWRRTYRHFDRHLEPHLTPARRLAMEVAFGNLRRELKMDRPDKNKVADLCTSIDDDLQTLD